MTEDSTLPQGSDGVTVSTPESATPVENSESSQPITPVEGADLAPAQEKEQLSEAAQKAINKKTWR